MAFAHAAMLSGRLASHGNPMLSSSALALSIPQIDLRALES
jgi:hypothetical protein